VAGLSTAFVCVHTLAWNEFESHRGHGCLSLVNVVCCQVEFSVYDYLSGGVLTRLQCLSDIWKFTERRGHDRNADRSATERKYICMGIYIKCTT